MWNVQLFNAMPDHAVREKSLNFLTGPSCSATMRPVSQYSDSVGLGSQRQERVLMSIYRTQFLFLFVTNLLSANASLVHSQEAAHALLPGDRMMADYFARETSRLADDCLKGITNREQWEAVRKKLRKQLLEMLGLEPLPTRTELEATVTGTTEHDEFKVQRLQFQSRPGLYVTGNLYLPNEASESLPAVLYVCGHGRVEKDGVSFGNKVHYQHHGAWFARNGYVCLTIDTLQLGEIEGIHHGTYRENMWWWMNRGYTPAGVEAWNCVRAIDYLQSRDEVDPLRIGVTGRSGGGAYSWWIAAIDDRIQCAVPVAGITDLKNHVIDGCVEGHCDCMYMVNTFRWDYPLVAALVAPRPLLISNTDSDGIFPLDGVYRTFERVRQVYSLYDAEDKVALNITAGPHKDTQELRVHAFRWLNQHLKRDESLIENPAMKFFEPEQLKVFEDLPKDQRNTDIHESFVALADPKLPDTSREWESMRQSWRESLMDRVFRGWPDDPGPLDVREAFRAEHNETTFRAVDFTSQQAIRLRLFLVHRNALSETERVVLNVMDEPRWEGFLASMSGPLGDQLGLDVEAAPNEASFREIARKVNANNWIVAYLAPRGIGPTAWDSSEFKQTQHRRRFYLLGQTLDGMRAFDVRRAIQMLGKLPASKDVPVRLAAHGQTAGIALYASLFEPSVSQLELYELPSSHRRGPYFLNVSRFMNMPQAVALAAEKVEVTIYGSTDSAWDYPQEVARRLKWPANSLRLAAP